MEERTRVMPISGLHNGKQKQPLRSSKFHVAWGLLAKLWFPGGSLLECLLPFPRVFWFQTEHFPTLFQRCKYIRAHYICKGERSWKWWNGIGRWRVGVGLMPKDFKRERGKGRDDERKGRWAGITSVASMAATSPHPSPQVLRGTSYRVGQVSWWPWLGPTFLITSTLESRDSLEKNTMKRKSISQNLTSPFMTMAMWASFNCLQTWGKALL